MSYHHNPSGYLRKKGDKWQACVDYPDPDRPGKRKRHTKNAPTKKEAQALLTAMMAEHQAQPQWRKPSEITLQEFLQKWLDDVVDVAESAPNTKEGKHIAVKHILSIMGHVKLIDVTPMDVQHLIKEMAGKTHDGGKPYASRTIRNVYTMLHAALNIAVDWDLITKNPAASVKPPKVTYQHHQPLVSEIDAHDQLAHFLRAAQAEGHYALWLTIVSGGLRIGEALSLTWADVDWDRQVLYVQKSQRDTAVGPAKNTTSRRMITYPATVMSALQYQQTTQKSRLKPDDWEEHHLIFPSERGTPMDSHNVRRAFRRIVKRANLPSTITPHSLRHTYATEMLESDVHLKVVQEQLGHSSSQMTSDLYMHLTGRVQKTAADAMEAILQSLKLDDSPEDNDPSRPLAQGSAKIRKQAAVDTQTDPK